MLVFLLKCNLFYILYQLKRLLLFLSGAMRGKS